MAYTMTEFLKETKGLSYRSFKNKPKHKRDKIREEYEAFKKTILADREVAKEAEEKDRKARAHKVKIYQTDEYIVEIEEDK